MAYTSKAKFTQEALKNIDELISEMSQAASSKPSERQKKISEKFKTTELMVGKAVSKYPDDPQKQMQELTSLGADINKVYINTRTNSVCMRDPNKFGFDEYDIKEVMKLADTRIERLAAPTFLKSSVDANMRVITGGGSKKGSAGTDPAASQVIQSSIYNTLLRSFDRKWNISMSTMGTDGKTIYMNPYITLALSLEKLKFIIAHEIMHVVLSHTSRFTEKYIQTKENYQNARNISPLKAIEDKAIHDVFNIALDLIINGQLVKDGWGEILKESDFTSFGADENDDRPGGCYIDGFENYTEDESIVALGNTFCRTLYDIYIEMCKKENKSPVLSSPLPDAENVHNVTENVRKIIRLLHESVEQQMISVSVSIGGQGQSQGRQGQNAPGGTSIHIQIGDSGQGQQHNQDQQQNQQGQSGQQINIQAGGQPTPGSKELGRAAAEAVRKIIDAVLKNETGASNTMDSHEENMQKIREYAKEKGFPNEAEAVKNDIDINVRQLLDAVMEDLAAKGITADDLMSKGYGCIGSNVAKAWNVKKDQPHRDYKIEIMEFVKRINGERFNTWDKWNKKNNALRSAARSIARKGGAMRTLLIPSTYNTSGRIVLAIDTSGSIFYDSESMKFAASEVMRLTEELQKRKGSIIDVLCCDTQIADHKRLKSGAEEFRDYIDEIEKNGVKMSGNGGTDLMPIWDVALDKDERFHEPGLQKPAGMIVVTDTQTANAHEIADMYISGECTIPTMVLVPNEECIIKEWKDLESKCRTFGIGIISELLKKEREQGYDLSAEPER